MIFLNQSKFSKTNIPWAPSMVAFTVDRILSWVAMVGILSQTWSRVWKMMIKHESQAVMAQLRSWLNLNLFYPFWPYWEQGSTARYPLYSFPHLKKRCTSLRDLKDSRKRKKTRTDQLRQDSNPELHEQCALPLCYNRCLIYQTLTLSCQQGQIVRLH